MGSLGPSLGLARAKRISWAWASPLRGSGATTANDGGIYVGTLSGASYSYAGPKRPTGAQADYEGLAISNNGGYAFAALGATGQQIYAGSGVL